MTTGSAPLRGRDAELGALRDELAAAAGGRRLAVVGGEAGIGKTRLVAELAIEAESLGAPVLWGSASDRLAKPYLPFVEAFGRCLESAPETVLRSDGELAELRRLVPEMGDALGESSVRANSPASEQFALFKASLSLLRLLSREHPLLLVLEDLHWADEASLLMLHYLLAGRGDFRGLVVATHRPLEITGTAALAGTLTRLGRDPGLTRIDPTPLRDDDVLSVLADLAGGGLVGGHQIELAAEIRGETSGNPLLVTELIRGLLGAGDLSETEGAWRLRRGLDSIPIPAPLLDAIVDRVRDLGDRAPQALSAAALCAPDFEPRAVSEALDTDAGELAATWERSESAGLLRTGESRGRLAFAHPLVSRALREALGAGRRAELERRLAEDHASAAPDRGRLEHRGDHWTILTGRSEVTLKDGKGIRYLANLIASPGVEMHAMDLQGGWRDPSQRSLTGAAARAAGLGMGTHDAGPMLDSTAKRGYRQRIEELEEEIEEAERFNDAERAERAREELEFLGRELAAAVGIGGRDRMAASEAERARVNVTRAIRGALSRIEAHDEEIGARLRVAVRTGAFCCYDPPPGVEIEWDVRLPAV